MLPHHLLALEPADRLDATGTMEQLGLAVPRLLGGPVHYALRQHALIEHVAERRAKVGAQDGGKRMLDRTPPISPMVTAIPSLPMTRWLLSL